MDPVYILRLVVSSLECRRCLHCRVVVSLVRCCHRICLRLLSLNFFPFNKVRYQHDHQVDVSPTTEILAPQFDFAQGLNKNQQQQIPILDPRLEPPNSSARQVTFSHYNHPQPPSYHQSHFPTQYSPVSSFIPATAHATTPSVNFRLIPPPTEQPSSGGPSHEPIYYQQLPVPSSSASMDADHRPNPVATAERTEPSMSNAVNTSREARKGITPVVIACRLW